MPFFGVPIRNGLPIGLGSVAGFGVQQFDPSQLFAGGTVAGAWYDPSDLSTMFTTSAGTTPVAMPGLGSAVSVGLMLDKSQGLVLGSELVANPDFTTDTWWLKDAGVTISGGTANWAATAATSQVYKTGILTVGALYKVTFTITSISSGGLRAVAGSGTFGSTRTTPGTYTEYLVAAGGGGTVAIQSVGASTTASVDNVSYQALAGNHAIAFNDTTARPELRARVNLLEYSEQFDNGYWLNYQIRAWGSGSVANATTAPDGTNTADLAVETTANDAHVPFYRSSTPSAGSYTFSVYAKAYAGSLATRYLALRMFATTSDFLYYTFDLASASFDAKAGSASTFTNISASNVDAGNGWRRLSVTFTCAATLNPIGSQISNVASPTLVQLGGLGAVSYTGDGTSGIYIWGADLRPTNIGANVPAYQRIADANTYDTSGFPLYLRFDGIDDSMYTPANLNLSGTDKVAVFAGVRRLTNTDGCVTELTSGTTNGFNLFASTIGGDSWFFSAWGAAQLFGTAAPYNAPITNVLTEQLDKAAATDATRISARVNAAAVSLSYTGSLGTPGNFANAPLYIGARGGNTIALNGHLHSLIIAGSAVSAGNISATEQWVAGKTGIVI